MYKYYLSKNYKERASAGNKAKTDVEQTVQALGYVPGGLPQTSYRNPLLGFLLTLAGVLKLAVTVSAGDVVLIQYPFKKYYAFVCRIVRLKKGKTITLIHDLGAFRRKKLSIEEEIRRLSLSDILIVHNEHMKQWLQGKGYTHPMICLEIFDYLSDTAATDARPAVEQPCKVMYAGALGIRKNRFLYLLGEKIHAWHFVLYGPAFDAEQMKEDAPFAYKGFIPSEQLISQAEGDFGLVWDGDATTSCSGNYGEYLKLNNPHKTSLYIRCHLPVIIWKEAALATFVAKHNIGLCIGSLEELDTLLPSITPDEYERMAANVRLISDNLASGYYITQALREAERLLCCEDF